MNFLYPRISLIKIRKQVFTPKPVLEETSQKGHLKEVAKFEMSFVDIFLSLSTS